MFEIDGVSEERAREALRLGAQKLPVKTNFFLDLITKNKIIAHGN